MDPSIPLFTSSCRPSHPSTQLSISPSLCPPIHPPTHPPSYSSIHGSISLSTHPPTNSLMHLFDCVKCSHQSTPASTHSCIYQANHPFVRPVIYSLAAHTNLPIHSYSHLSVSPPNLLSTQLFTFLSTHSSTRLPVFLSTHLSSYPTVYINLPAHPSIPQSLDGAVPVYPPPHPRIHPSNHPLVFLIYHSAPTCSYNSYCVSTIASLSQE